MAESDACIQLKRTSLTDLVSLISFIAPFFTMFSVFIGLAEILSVGIETDVCAANKTMNM